MTLSLKYQQKGIFRLIAICCFCFLSGIGFAQDNNSNKTSNEGPGPLYINVVQQWAKETNFAYNSSKVIVGILQMDTQNNPKMKAAWSNGLKLDLEQYFYELFYSPETIAELAQIYSQYFTLDDMLDLLKFYRSPVGQKLIKAEPALQVQMQQLGEKLLKEHEKRYMLIIGKYMKPEAVKP